MPLCRAWNCRAVAAVRAERPLETASVIATMRALAMAVTIWRQRASVFTAISWVFVVSLMTAAAAAPARSGQR